MNPSLPVPDDTAAPLQQGFAPEVFGKYYLVDRIAVGGMAEIFKAKTYGVGGFENVCVIKRILKHLSENEQFVRMFMDEAKVSALLQHNNVVRVYDFGKQRENYFIAMEYVEGKDVKQILRKLAERRKLLPQEFAVYIAMEAAKGLDYAHKRTTLQGQPLGIVHRDVSPSNLLVSYNGEVKAADFGIVQAANCAEDTDAGTLKGKFEYMSPEQAQGLELDRRSDLFSLGIILHEMLTGRRAFKSENEIRTLERIKAVEIDPPSFFNPRVPARLDEIVMRALARDPDDRYQDGRQLQVDLLEFLYPASPDLTQQSLSHFMRELFAEEAEAERRRLEEGSRLALAVHESTSKLELEPEWEDGGESRGSRGTTPTQAPMAPAPAPSRVPLFIAAIAVLLMIGVVTVSILLPILNPPAPQVVEKMVEAPRPTTGALEITIGPVEGKVSIDGAVVGQGPTVAQEALTPDQPHVIRVEAENYQPYETSVTLKAGERLRLPVALVAVPVVEAPRNETRDRPPDTTEKPPVVGAPSVRFTSTPGGVDVFIDGRLAGRTPFTWKEGEAGGRVSVEYRLAGYDGAKGTVSLPAAGGTASFDRTLQERAKGDGKLNVNVSGGWADIYVNDKKIGQTPKFGIVLAAGTYTVRVKNESTGLDQTRQLTISAGETKTASFSAD